MDSTPPPLKRWATRLDPVIPRAPWIAGDIPGVSPKSSTAMFCSGRRLAGRAWSVAFDPRVSRASCATTVSFASESRHRSMRYDASPSVSPHSAFVLAPDSYSAFKASVASKTRLLSGQTRARTLHLDRACSSSTVRQPVVHRGALCAHETAGTGDGLLPRDPLLGDRPGRMLCVRGCRAR